MGDSTSKSSNKHFNFALAFIGLLLEYYLSQSSSSLKILRLNISNHALNQIDSTKARLGIKVSASAITKPRVNNPVLLTPLQMNRSIRTPERQV
jgi:hypothetical protein